MNINRHIKAALLTLVGLALASAVPRAEAQTILNNGFTNNFPNNGATNLYAASGSATWFYWYDFGGSVSNNPNVDAGGNPSSGSLDVYLPFSTDVTSFHNALFCGTFANNPANAYDFSVRANLLLYSNISFDILVDSNQTPFTSTNATNFGRLGVGIINASYGYQHFGDVTIPASASNHWTHMSVPIDKTQDNLANAPGIVIDGNNYNGYPHFPAHFWIDNIAANAPPAPPPPPPTLGNLQPAINGLDCIGTSSANYQRYQLATVADTGYTFVGQPSVTYSWSVKSFPTNSDWQQHFFIVNGAPGQYDQAADYNLADCLFMTVFSAGPGQPAAFSFRYKTNQPGGNAMLFNTMSPTNPANTNLWPVMPVCSLTNASGPLGTWSVTFANTTNVTITDPDGGSTNFVLDSASAALFADPVTLIVGGQPNTSGFGQTLVYNSFSAAGCAAPFSDNFVTDTALNTNLWKNLANDTNGVVLAPPGSKYWLSWSLPDAGFSLQSVANLPANNAWADLSSLGLIKNTGMREALLNSSNLPSPNSGYFSLIQRVYSKLQVLFPGETNAPNTVSGKTGTPTPVPGGGGGFASTPVTVLAVDSAFFPVSGVNDALSISSSDASAILPAGNVATLANGTVTFNVAFSTTNSTPGFTVSVTDTNNGFMATSSPVVVTP